MSTDLKPVNDTTTVTRFWGGKARGVCVQVTQSGQGQDRFNPMGVGYVQLTAEDARKLGEQLLAFAADPMSRELEED